MSIKTHLETEGWVILPIFTNSVECIRTLIYNNNESPGGYVHFKNNDLHITNQKILTQVLRDSDLVKKFFIENQLIFEGLLGGPFLYQDAPYLRIARPNRYEDNIGFHKDTMYGGYPEELSVVIPITPITEDGMALQVMDKSHLIPDAEFAYTQTVSEDVQKGDEKNNLGFLYAPKILDKSKLNMHPVVQQWNALVFYLSTVHGQEINTSRNTRWTIDTRIVRADTERDFSQRPYKYVTL